MLRKSNGKRLKINLKRIIILPKNWTGIFSGC